MFFKGNNPDSDFTASVEFELTCSVLSDSHVQRQRASMPLALAGASDVLF